VTILDFHHICHAPSGRVTYVFLKSTPVSVKFLRGKTTSRVASISYKIPKPVLPLFTALKLFPAQQTGHTRMTVDQKKN